MLNPIGQCAGNPVMYESKVLAYEIRRAVPFLEHMTEDRLNALKEKLMEHNVPLWEVTNESERALNELLKKYKEEDLLNIANDMNTEDLATFVRYRFRVLMDEVQRGSIKCHIGWFPK